MLGVGGVGVDTLEGEREAVEARDVVEVGVSLRRCKDRDDDCSRDVF